VTTSPGGRTDRGSRCRGAGRDSGIHLTPPTPPLTSPLSLLLPRTADANGLQALSLRRPPPSCTSLAPSAVKTVPPFTTSAPRLGGGRPCTSPHGNGHSHAPCVPAAKTAACPVAARPCGGYATPLLAAGSWQRHAHTRGALHRAACFFAQRPPTPIWGSSWLECTRAERWCRVCWPANGAASTKPAVSSCALVPTRRGTVPRHHLSYTIPGRTTAASAW